MTEETTPHVDDTFEPLLKLSKDLKAAASNMGEHEARFLVDSYYTMQDQRIRTAGQIRAMSGDSEPHGVIDWLFNNSKGLENTVKSALGCYSRSRPTGQWLNSICGIGPVISAGMLAHFDYTKPTASHFWRFAGLDPTVEWKKGERRPWNASVKTLCWKLGESFVKVQSRESDVYGFVYVAKKAKEIEINEARAFADQAKAKLEKFNIGKTTDAYKCYIEGKLPPAHIHARAKRYAVWLFLSHLHCVGYFVKNLCLPPLIWSVAHGGHVHVIEPPNMDVVDGFEDAWREQNPGSVTVKDYYTNKWY